jgi:hypothetical protein
MIRTIDVVGPRGETVPIEGIRLRKDGEYTVVDAEIGGEWIEVIRERSDGQFCHIVEPSGMFAAFYAEARAALEPKP